MTIETKEARDIVSSLAVSDPMYEDHSFQGDVCIFCRLVVPDGNSVTPEDHDEKCVWRRAHDLCFPEEQS